MTKQTTPKRPKADPHEIARSIVKPSPGNTHGSTFKDMRELDAHQQLLVRNDEKRKDGTVHVTFESGSLKI